MKSIVFIFIIVFIIGCSSNENLVSVRQTQNNSPVILRIRKDRSSIHSLLYPIAFEFKKNSNREISYCENSYFAKNENICPGTAGCYLRVDDKDKYLTYSYKKFDGTIKYITDKNDTIKEYMSVYYKKMINENKDTIHVSLKEFNNNFKYIIDNFFEGDSIYLHFHDHKRWIDVPLRVSFN
ncbi:hypothetical protein [Phocaeicola coprocola]|uniref:hypothetical protein n=1 Tax=Phocaeicola coprocola TaxID=310298 RepID=UPI0022DEE608|nr:hypothetical protein [Phocaeicola coprocola]